MDSLFPTKELLKYVVNMFVPSGSRKISYVLCGGAESRPISGILRKLYKEFGMTGLIKGDLILFGWALALTAVSDVFFNSTPVLQTATGAVICFFMSHVMDDDIPHALLITAFIIANCEIGGLWVLTALFIILFEHINLKREGL